MISHHSFNINIFISLEKVCTDSQERKDIKNNLIPIKFDNLHESSNILKTPCVKKIKEAIGNLKVWCLLKKKI